MAIDISSFYIYRFRYYLGYGLISLLLVGLLVFAGLYTPGGLSSQEMSTVVKSSNIDIASLSSLAVTNLPYHLLQQASLNLFGINEFSIKLPSLALGLLSAVGLILLLRQWFKPRIAVLASIIAITTGQFLFTAQNGNPDILYVFWPVYLLLLGTLIAKRVKWPTVWKILFFIVAALSLYTPLGVYALLALAISAVLHPHLRFIVHRLSKLKLLIAFLFGLVIATPLMIGVYSSPELGLNILGIPAVWPDLMVNALTLSNQYFGFASASSAGLMTPIFGLGSMLIIAFGIYKLIRTRESTQSYLIIIWLVCLIPVLLINPGFASITFLPMVLLLATGLESLLGYWYRLFPLNPYARIAGLIPLVVLISVLVLSGLERYIYGYHYDPNSVANFSKDLTLLPKSTKNLIVTNNELPFYKVVAEHRPGLNVTTDSTPTSTFTTTHDVDRSSFKQTLDRIVTSAASKDADRFYIYKN